MTSPHPVRVGLELSPQHCTIDELRAVWRIADEAGFDHVWGFDHLAAITGDFRGPVFEGWTLLAAMAEVVDHARIGLMVTGNTYRHPGLLAKMAVTVDHLSGGRLEFGLGAAWAEIEHTMLGLHFGTVGERIDRMAEACEVITRLWADDRADYAGRHYTLTDAIANPKPLQRPRPPIWIGGRGERKTLRVVARYADVWNVGGGDPDEAARVSGVLDGHCGAVGRDPAEIRRSVQIFYDGDEDALMRLTAAYAERGFEDVIVIVRGGRGRPDAESVAAALPRVRSLG
jgi:F420-dependent oxidoreductase-like protein